MPGEQGMALPLAHPHSIVSQNKGAQYRPKYTIVLTMGIAEKVPLILGNPHVDFVREARRVLTLLL